MWKHDKHFEKETDVEILTSIERDKINKLKEKHVTRKKYGGGAETGWKTLKLKA